jgi:glutaminase
MATNGQPTGEDAYATGAVASSRGAGDDAGRGAGHGAGSGTETIERTIGELHARYADERSGELATYIPELACADPEHFGIAIATTGGDVFTAGDAGVHFTMQSISKPFIYGMALQDRGREEVLRRVGVEPTGDTFNSIIKLDAANRPHNPMVNAGAIATTSLLSGERPTGRLRRMLDMFTGYLGEPATIDTPVFVSERSTGHRNRAIAHLLLTFGMIEDDVDAVLDLYFQQCSVRVSAASLAMMAATLANGGVNPKTGRRVIDAGYIRDILTVMFTCGMYNFAGQWAYTVGLPAKSGVAGGLIAVAPGRFGLAVYSPLLDEHSHSVRGIRVCEDLSRNSGMHVFDTLMRPREERRPAISGGASAPAELPVSPTTEPETRRDRFAPPDGGSAAVS